MERRITFQDDCIAALATPLGESALAVIRTSGPGCIEALAACTSSPSTILEAPGNTLVYGFIIDPQVQGLPGGAISEQVDQVMFGVYRAPRSYTGEDSVEIFCHGSVPGIDRILQVLFSQGFRQAGGGEFTLRAFMNGKMDLTRAEAVQEIVSARTQTAQAMALHRLGGSVENRINELKSDLVKVMAGISVQLDYPEDEIGDVPMDVPMVDRAISGLQALAATYQTGRLYQEGVVIALAGRTNAGKSSLFNLFLKEDRSIVSDIHGTTRDYIESVMAIGGIPVRLFDTAGLRNIDETIESEGIRRTGQVVSRADLVLYLVDGTLGLEPEDEEHLANLTSRPHIRIWNKADAGDCKPRPEGWVALSTFTTEGFDLLHREILSLLGPGGVTGVHSGDIIIDSPRQKRCLEDAVAALLHLKEGMLAAMPLDVLALDLQTALNSLGEITGEVTREDILDAMFSGFCVGK